MFEQHSQTIEISAKSYISKLGFGQEYSNANSLDNSKKIINYNANLANLYNAKESEFSIDSKNVVRMYVVENVILGETHANKFWSTKILFHNNCVGDILVKQNTGKEKSAVAINGESYNVNANTNLFAEKGVQKTYNAFLNTHKISNKYIVGLGTGCNILFDKNMKYLFCTTSASNIGRVYDVSQLKTEIIALKGNKNNLGINYVNTAMRNITPIYNYNFK